MVIANIGTISLALPTKDVTSGLPATSTLASNAGVSTAATQVRLLSLSNTISRITTGPMADFISPVASYLPSGLLMLPRQHKVSRVAFLLGACLLMTVAFLWMTFGVTSQKEIWAFRFALVFLDESNRFIPFRTQYWHWHCVRIYLHSSVSHEYASL